MSFSEHYFSRYQSLPAFFGHFPDPNVAMIVVIPCYDDEFIFRTLLSLENTMPCKKAVEVIVVVNAGENADKNIIRSNKQIFGKLKEQSRADHYKRFKLLPILLENISQKKAGVGYARKAGMDEAIRRFSLINQPKGIIISLDADCIVSRDYFTLIEHIAENSSRSGGFVFQFKHNFDPALFSPDEIKACKLYETYLRYYKLALAATGFPYCFHTIGSCFAVSASAYVKAGGMSCRQGGEDFYFLHKLAQMTRITEIADILVYPAPRISTRVPFGTGPTVKTIINNGEYHVYNFELFLILKRFFKFFEHLSVNKDIDLNKIPKEIITFAGENNLLNTIHECMHNVNNPVTLTKRLYSKFDAFFIVKFLNSFDNDSSYPRMKVSNAVHALLEYYKQNSYSGFTPSQKKDLELIAFLFNK